MTFDPFKALREIVQADAHLGGRKLSFPNQCAAFAALYDGVRNQVVSRAFGISAQTTSQLSGCLEHDPDPYRTEYSAGQNEDLEQPRRVERDHNRNRSPSRFRHYQTVAREFEALGREEFTRRYMTPAVIDRIVAARRELAAERSPAAASNLWSARNLDDDGYPDFARMNNDQMVAWRDANPEKWIARFGENKPQTPIDKDRD